MLLLYYAMQVNVLNIYYYDAHIKDWCKKLIVLLEYINL